MPAAADGRAPLPVGIPAAEAHCIDAGQDLVVVIDTLVDGVHFPSATPPADVGFKSLAVNLSDLAAMGAAPFAARVSVTLPWEEDDTAHAWLSAFQEGLGNLARCHGVAIGAMAITRGPLSVTVEALGSVFRGEALRRGGAAAGDCILVTGTLGDAGLALADESAALSPEDRDWVQARLARPQPRLAAGMALRGLASAAIDVSDGLCADLGHVLAASTRGARVNVERIPLSPVLARVLPRERAWKLALASGDDYELCFTVPPEQLSEAERRISRLACGATRIGTVTVGNRLEVLRADGSAFDAGSGYRHFR